MNIADFKRIITSFADNPTDIDINKGTLIAEIRGELIEAKIIQKDGTIFIIENDLESNAINWIANRIACLHLLSDRIIDYIKEEPHFIIPEGLLLDDLENDPNETEVPVEDTVSKILEVLNRQIPGTSNVVYLTSDAGEGKTTLINKISHIQAKKFKNKESNWLIVPIPLGGRPFLRFDDIVIASIVNRLRFRFFYYESFIELVKLGLIVPAFDGFEEMFMENSTGEALSATGNLMNRLESSGRVLIAARKAYFDYKNFNSQAKLFDSIASNSVAFARISILRWNRSRFVEYADLKGVENGDGIYDLVLSKLMKPNHPILTRPVLVNQLLEIFNSIEDASNLAVRLETSSNYFLHFVHAIIEREANLKWIDKSGEPYKPLLSIDEHYLLLAWVAEEMWFNNTETLKESVLDLISEMFSENRGFSTPILRQVKERVKQHALIVKSEEIVISFEFDHEEFREFFLGISIVDKIKRGIPNEVKNILRKSLISSQTTETVVSRLKLYDNNSEKYKVVFDAAIKGEGPTSFVRENLGNILIHLLNNINNSELEIYNYEFPPNSLSFCTLQNIFFKNCHFQTTSLESSKFANCRFVGCSFDLIEKYNNTVFDNVSFEDTSVNAIFEFERERNIYNPDNILSALMGYGIRQLDEPKVHADIPKNLHSKDEDESLHLTLKILRKFMRATTITDSIIRMKLGNYAQTFMKDILPELEKHNILVEIGHSGQGQKRRFKLNVQFGMIEEALNNSNGNFYTFVSFFNN